MFLLWNLQNETGRMKERLVFLVLLRMQWVSKESTEVTTGNEAAV